MKCTKPGGGPGSVDNQLSIIHGSWIVDNSLGSYHDVPLRNTVATRISASVKIATPRAM
jgi:hypothetical protein